MLDYSTSLIETRKEAFEKTIQYIKENRSTIREILSEISTYRTADEEIDTSIRVLENGLEEVRFHQPPITDKMSVFMPSNVILYSYVLYLLIPSLYVKKLEFRSSSLVIDQVRKLHHLLKEVHNLPIELLELSHRKYIKHSALEANTVVFTGTYVNAEEIKFQLSKNQVFVFFGQGVNPFIVGETAKVDEAVKDLIKVRMYNTGQDCMGPDAIYVHESISEEFSEKLTSSLLSLKFGLNTDPESDYGKIHYTSTLETVAQYLNKNSEFIIHGGSIDYRNKVMEPTILSSSIKQKIEIDEFFSPIFNIIIYQNNEELKQNLQKGYFMERALGASVYGTNEDSLIQYLEKKHTVSVNQTLFDIEDGNKPFGGFGPRANYVSYQNNLYIKPQLLSMILSEYWKDTEENL